MTEQEYVEQRLEDQIDWYDKKSQSAQTTYKRLRRAEIVFAALIPVLAALGNQHSIVPIVMGVFGAVVVVISAFVSLGSYQENWIQYRTTCESLRHEKFRFLTKTDPYVSDNKFSLLVERVENLISKENTEWSQTATGVQTAQGSGRV